MESEYKTRGVWDTINTVRTIAVSMITIIGTGHVFNISEQIMFLVKQIWPQAVLVELDESRLRMLEASRSELQEKAGEEQQELPWIYRSSAKYQARMAKKYGTRTGNELLTAVQTGRLVGAEIGTIDMDVVKLTQEMWDEMPFFERARYTISTVIDRFGGKRRAEKAVEDFTEREDKTLATMRRRYPTLIRKLIDERNDYMAERIAGYVERYDNIVVVVGDTHVEGLSKHFEDMEIRKIRLGDILNKESLDRIKAEVWNR